MKSKTFFMLIAVYTVVCWNIANTTITREYEKALSLDTETIVRSGTQVGQDIADSSMENKVYVNSDEDYRLTVWTVNFSSTAFRIDQIPGTPFEVSFSDGSVVPAVPHVERSSYAVSQEGNWEWVEISSDDDYVFVMIESTSDSDITMTVNRTGESEDADKFLVINISLSLFLYAFIGAIIFGGMDDLKMVKWD